MRPRLEVPLRRLARNTTIEVEYGGKWHYFDVSQVYYWSKDKSTSSPGRNRRRSVDRARPVKEDARAVRTSAAATAPGVRGCKRATVGETGLGVGQWRDRNYSTSLTLPSGRGAALDWKSLRTRSRSPARRRSFLSTKTSARQVLGPCWSTTHPDWSDGSLGLRARFSKAADVSDSRLTGAAARAGNWSRPAARASRSSARAAYAYVEGRWRDVRRGRQALRPPRRREVLDAGRGGRRLPCSSSATTRARRTRRSPGVVALLEQRGDVAARPRPGLPASWRRRACRPRRTSRPASSDIGIRQRS